MCTDCFSKVEAQALRLHDEFWLDTILYFRNYREIFCRFDDWKDIDRFYFIPLKLNMTYSIGGHSISMADDTIHLGTFVRNSLEHPDLFSFRCPKCGEPLYPYGYSGSPLSGRVDLQGYCDCGWGAFVVFSGWKVRSEALKATQGSDRLRLAKYRALKPLKGPSATIQELLDWLHS